MKCTYNPERKERGYHPIVSVPVRKFVQVGGVTPEINVSRRKRASETAFEVLCQPGPSHEIDKLGARIGKHKRTENSLSLTAGVLELVRGDQESTRT